MSKVLKIEANIFIEVEDDADPEEVAQEMDLGLEHNISSFPKGEVIAAGVERISVADDDELDEKGLKEI